MDKIKIEEQDRPRPFQTSIRMEESNQLPYKNIRLQQESLGLFSSGIGASKSIQDVYVNTSSSSSCSSVKLQDYTESEKRYINPFASNDFYHLLDQPCSSKQADLILKQFEAVSLPVQKVKKIKKRFQCPICKIGLSSFYVRVQHINYHFKYNPVSCFSCGKFFVNKKRYFLHNVIHCVKKRRPRREIPVLSIPEDPEDPEDLPYPFENNLVTNGKVIDDSVIFNKPQFECEVCLEQLTSFDALQQHLKSHPKSFDCDLCPKTFTRKSTLTQHKLTHLSPQFKCEICFKLFKSKSNRNRHLLTHSQIRNSYFKCTMCLQKFSKTISFVNHWFSHQEKLQQQCKRCNKRYIKYYELLNHYKKEHFTIPEEVTFACCPYCEINFTKESLLEHLDTKHEELKECGLKKPFTCQYCPMSFISEQALDNHVSVDRRPVQCNICCIEICNYDSLVKHLQEAHINLKTPFLCVICTREFPDKDTLVSHLLSEQGTDSAEYYKQCEICRWNFFDEQEFNAHWKSLHHLSLPVEEVVEHQEVIEPVVEKTEEAKDEFDIVYEALEIKEDTVEYSGFFDLC
ncbi:zinc finger protein 84-like [Diabrotica virgifera virgifera]|uniref:Zinc finger protein 84-like n=1 Tax=Diabrotica virgifera virgifera TaxID=50390 RepID=A0A6P7G1X6_DIAVI|nr:zinc finger protein 84-like [Diabrotica virgifera virgifera]